jgi:hypothetical protein
MASCKTETTVLSGDDGTLYMAPPGTRACLKDQSSFRAGEIITVPLESDFSPGDPVVFTEQEGATLDSALTAGTVYYVSAVSSGQLAVSATKGGAAITLAGDGGVTGTGIGALAPSAGAPGAGYVDGVYTNVRLIQGIANTARATITVASGVPAVTAITNEGLNYTAATDSVALTGGRNENGQAIDEVAPSQAFLGDPTLTSYSDTSGGEILLAYSGEDGIANMVSFEITLSREERETSSIPAYDRNGKPLSGNSIESRKYTSFRKYQAGYGDGSATITINFSADNESMVSRILGGVFLRRQQGCRGVFYLNHVQGAGGAIDLDASSYVDVDLTLLSVNSTLTTGAENQQATISTRFAEQPRHLFIKPLT